MPVSKLHFFTFCLQVGVVPLEWERPAVLSYFLFLFYLLLGYVNGVEEMEFKMRVPYLRQQKNRSPAFVSLKGACFYFSFASQSLVGHSPAEKEVSVIHLTFSLRGGLGLMCLWVRGKNHCVSIAIH